MSTEKKQIAIIGASGYTGASLVKILSAHPQVEIKYLSSNQYIGQKYSSIFPEFTGLINLECINADTILSSNVILESRSESGIQPTRNSANTIDLVFFATPNGFAYKYAPDLIAKGIHVIDLSADYRFKDLAVYETWYGFSRNDQELNAKAIYGLVEFNRDLVKAASNSKGAVIIGNPGCYTTSSILALGPLLKYASKKNPDLIDWNSIIIDGKSGVSGAGRKAETQLLYTELNESCSPYNLGGKHRHIPELETFFSDLCARNINLTFSPHLIPMSYGLLTTSYMSINDTKFTEKTLRGIYQDFYQDEKFVHLLDCGNYPKTGSIIGSNNTHLQVNYDSKTSKAIITCAIDNLYKGAAGQAVQNMNLVFGFEESMSL